MSKVPVASCTPRESSSGSPRRALDVLRGQARDQAPGQVLQEADGAALGREAEVAIDGVSGIDQQIGHRSLHIGLLDPAGNLHLEPLGEPELVEDEAGGAWWCGWDRTARLRRPERRDSPWLACTPSAVVSAANRRSNGASCTSTRPSCDLLVKVCCTPSKPFSIRQLVVLVVAGAEPEANGVDGGGLRPHLALAGHPGLVRVDARAGLRRLDAGNAIEAIELIDGNPDEAAVEQHGAAHRLPAGSQRGIGLPAVDDRRRDRAETDRDSSGMR